MPWSRKQDERRSDMIGILIVTHGEIGKSLLESATQILGARPAQVSTLSVWRQDDPDDLVLRARELMDQIDAGNGVLILTDIFGATPGNVVSKLLQDGKVEGVSGVSLPMLLRVLTGRNGANPAGLSVLVQRAMTGGAEGLVHMNTDRCCDA
jgi:PTS system mannose-specific IIA component